MDRKEHILKHIEKSGFGLEIGPSHNPIAAKKDGYNVDVVDHLSRAQLMDKYADHGVDLDKIEEVDYIWNGQSFAELTGKRGHYDWIISSHSIEHSPDFIAFLNGCAQVLKDDGVISLAVPDQRFSFDHFRALSGLGEVIDAHSEKRKAHSAGKVAEHFLNAVSKGGEIAWAAHSHGNFEPVHDLLTVKQHMQAAIDSDVYQDVHAWCFVPNSFRLLMNDLHLLGYTELKEVDYFSPIGSEFYINLSTSGVGPAETRLELQQAIHDEIKFALPPPIAVNTTIEKAETGGFMSRLAKKIRG